MQEIGRSLATYNIGRRFWRLVQRELRYWREVGLFDEDFASYRDDKCIDSRESQAPLWKDESEIYCDIVERLEQLCFLSSLFCDTLVDSFFSEKCFWATWKYSDILDTILYNIFMN